MKKLALILFAGISFVTANAQLEVGVKGGVNFATLTGSDIVDAKSITNFNAGAFIKLPISRIASFQPEVVYSGQGANVNADAVAVQHLRLDYLDIPLLVKFAHRSGVYLETGPQLGFLLSAKDKIENTSHDFKQDLKSANVAWDFGIGVKVPHTPIGLDFRYVLGITNIEDVGQTAGTGAIRNDVFQLGLTFVLFSTPRK